MDWKMKNPGKVPTVVEQKAIAKSALTELTEPGMLWGENKYPLYNLPPNLAEWADATQKRAAELGLPPLTAAQLKKAFEKTRRK